MIELLKNNEINLTEYKEETNNNVKMLVEEIEANVENNRQNWLDLTTNFALKNTAQKQRASMIEMALLYTVKKNWHNTPPEKKGDWDGDFYKWANDVRLKAGGDEQSIQTIDNKIRVFKVFYSDKRIPYPKTVQNPNDAGKFCNSQKELEKVPPTKLLVATGFVKKEGIIPSDILKVLIDKKTSKTDVQKAIRDYQLGDGDITPENKTEQPKQELIKTKKYLFTKEDGIYYQRGDTSYKLYDKINQLGNIALIEGSKTLLEPFNSSGNCGWHYNGLESYREQSKEQGVGTTEDGLIYISDGITEFTFDKTNAVRLAEAILEQVKLQES